MGITSQFKGQAVSLLVLAILFFVPAKGQTKDHIFSAVPVSVRARLVERLRLLIDSERLQQWQKQYDLLSVLVTQGENKEEYVKRLEHSYSQGLETLLVEFVPESATYKGGGPSDVVIFGCAKVLKKDNVEKVYASIEAYREKGDWYFSPVGIIGPIGGKSTPCPYSSSKSSP